MSEDVAIPIFTNSALLGCFFVAQIACQCRAKSLVGTSREFATCALIASLLSTFAVLVVAADPEFRFVRGGLLALTFFPAIFSVLFMPAVILIEAALLIEARFLRLTIDRRTMYWHWVSFLVSICWTLSVAIMVVPQGQNP